MRTLKEVVTLKQILNAAIFVVIGFGIMAFLATTLHQEDPRIIKNQRIIDSLRREIAKNERRRDSLTAVIKNLDFEIQEQERVIDSLSKRKPTPLPPPEPPPKPSDARNILDKFRRG